MKEMKLNEVELKNDISSNLNALCEDGGEWTRLNIKEAVASRSEMQELTSRLNQLSNPNLFINGNFQIWSNGESFDVYGVNSEEYYETICDRWRVKHYDIYNNYLVTKESNGIRFESDSEEPCYVFQQLDEETFNSLQGKTLTLSYSYTNDTGETITDTKEIIANSDLDILTAKTRLGFTNGYVLHWAKLEVGEVTTPCIPDSKDAIICKIEQKLNEKPMSLCSGANTGGVYVEHTIENISKYKMLFLCAMVSGTRRIIASTVIFPNYVTFGGNTWYNARYYKVEENYTVYCYFENNTKCYIKTEDNNNCGYALFGVK